MKMSSEEPVTEPHTVKNGILTLYVTGFFLLAALLFYIRLNIPLGVAGGVVYVLLVIYTTLIPRPELTIYAALIATGLILLGYIISLPEGGNWKYISNRGISLFSVWTVAIFIFLWGRSKDRALATQRQLTIQKTQKMEALGRLAAGAAHEINNTLAGILSLADLIKKGSANPDAVDDIIGETKRVTQIVKDLHMYSRTDYAEFKQVSMDELLDRVIRIVKPDLKKYRIEIETDIDENIPAVYANESQIHQAILNLILNARDAMPDGGRIYITLKVEGERIRIDVTDTGKGIHESIFYKIFDPLFTTKDKDKGTGLGLSVTMGIIKAHGGDINVKNDKKLGASFTFYLPCADIRH